MDVVQADRLQFRRHSVAEPTGPTNPTNPVRGGGQRGRLMLDIKQEAYAAINPLLGWTPLGAKV